MIHENDIYFILNKTKLTIKQLISLLEEDRDFHLVISSVASFLQEEDLVDLLDLSTKLRMELSIYYYSKSYNFDISESIFMVDLLFRNYDFFFKNGKKIRKSQKKEITDFLSVLKRGSIFSHEKPIFISFFKSIKMNEIISHYDLWVKSINDAKPIILGVNINENKKI